ncbi:MAG TPA: 7-cyano-7-deazaguanine synthase QueC [Gemmatimonadaceae bacterium]|nr:7-cyano-7-deazaguanine synthase QueC [Gemmatimonadaceae bacterium]
MSGSPAKAAVVLLSGGLDSTTALAIATAEARRVHALTVRYGQRHERELQAARDVAAAWRVAAHKIIEIDLRTFGGSALTDESIGVPRDETPGQAGIPATYVPARNTILLSLALAWAEVIPAGDIFIGVNALDYSGYPDCRPEFIAAFEQVARLGTRAGSEGATGIRVRAPLIDLTKREIIQLGTSLGVDYSQTVSCYDPTTSGEACGRCDACQLRLRGFAEAGMADPVRYAAASIAQEARA